MMAMPLPVAGFGQIKNPLDMIMADKPMMVIPLCNERGIVHVCS